MKTIKIMSDGNQAKVGMICDYIENEKPLRIEIGVITHIKPSNRNELTDAIDESDVLFKPINAIYDWKTPNNIHFASLCRLSKATLEQKKLYWLELEKQTIQFRPEFEAKLKELGIRDKFVNNLFDPKCQTKEFNKERGLKEIQWDLFILRSFDWYLTPEQEYFWRSIYSK